MKSLIFFRFFKLNQIQQFSLLVSTFFKDKSLKMVLAMACVFLSGIAQAESVLHTLLVIGDSLTEGYGLEKNKAYPALLEDLLNQEASPKKGKSLSPPSNWKVINAGQSGWTSASGLSQLKWQLKGQNKPKILILALGANDGLRGLKPQTTKDNLRSVITLAKKEKIDVVLAGMMAPPNYGPTYTREFQRIFKDLAQEEKIELIPFLLENVAGEKSMNIEDGIHPNEAGHKIIATTVFKHVKVYTQKYSPAVEANKKNKS